MSKVPQECLKVDLLEHIHSIYAGELSRNLNKQPDSVLKFSI